MAESGEIAALERRAAEGDANAQYALAAALARRGKRDDAEGWLQSAASAGHADALYTIATRSLLSTGAIGDAAALLDRAAAAGSAAAIRLRAVLRALGLGGPEDERRAIADICALAEQGLAAALREIACVIAADDIDDARIPALIAGAGARDPVAAAFCAARAAAGRPAADRALVDQCVSLLAALRYPRAGFLKDAIGATEFASLEAGRIDWDDAAKSVTLTPRRRSPAAERLCDRPEITIVRNAVAPEICEYVIAHSAPRLGPSLVYNPQTDGMIRDPLRNSATASLSPADLDLALVAVNRTIADAARCDARYGEFLSVLHYAPGQQYRPHFDCIPAGADRDRNGQRVKTALLFLNDDYVGGETHFLAPDLKVKGGRGDILVFSNVDAEGRPDPKSRHAGVPVAHGEKWLGSKWFRDKKYRI